MIKEHEIGIRFSMFLYFFTFDNNDIKYGNEEESEAAIKELMDTIKKFTK